MRSNQGQILFIPFWWMLRVTIRPWLLSQAEVLPRLQIMLAMSHLSSPTSKSVKFLHNLSVIFFPDFLSFCISWSKIGFALGPSSFWSMHLIMVWNLYRGSNIRRNIIFRTKTFLEFRSLNVHRGNDSSFDQLDSPSQVEFLILEFPAYLERLECIVEWITSYRDGFDFPVPICHRWHQQISLQIFIRHKNPRL